MATIPTLTTDQLNQVTSSPGMALRMAYEMLRSIQSGHNFDTADYLHRLAAIATSIDRLNEPEGKLDTLSLAFLEITFGDALRCLEPLPEGNSMRPILIGRCRNVIDEYQRRNVEAEGPAQGAVARQLVRGSLDKLWSELYASEMPAHRAWAVKL